MLQENRGGAMSKLFKLSAIAIAINLACFSAPLTSHAAKYDMVTSTKAMVARDALQSFDMTSMTNKAKDASTDMYTPDIMNSIIENNKLEYIVLKQDRCQFTADIEDRARLVKSPVFMYAWGQMLLNGICVRAERDLALGYIRRAADDGYAPAMVQMAEYFEKGTFMHKSFSLSEQYMHTAAALGSKTARLNWADMLIRGYGSPSLYEEAYAWLYHSQYEDEYSQMKKIYLESQLKKFLPPNVIARNEAFEPDI